MGKFPLFHFGEYDHHSPYYIITMLFHDQNADVQSAIEKLACIIALGYGMTQGETHTNKPVE